MPGLKDRHLVISCIKEHRETYEDLCEWLNTTNYFKWTDDSVPYSQSLETAEKKRRRLMLRRRIEDCSCVVLLSELYEGCREWMDLMIDTANEFHKPMIGVKARDESPVPRRLQINCRMITRCEQHTIVAAIQECSL